MKELEELKNNLETINDGLIKLVESKGEELKKVKEEFTLLAETANKMTLEKELSKKIKILEKSKNDINEKVREYL